MGKGPGLEIQGSVIIFKIQKMASADIPVLKFSGAP